MEKDYLPISFSSSPALLRRNKECPTCRKKLVSKRSLRHDPNFDALISKIYPSRDEYEAHQRRALDRFKQLHNPQPLILSIEEGIRLQAKYRSGVSKGSRGGRMGTICFVYVTSGNTVEVG